MQDETAALLDQLRHLARGVVEIPKISGHGRTIGDASRLLAGQDALAAEIALGDDADFAAFVPIPLERRGTLVAVVIEPFGHEVAVGIRARHHAASATDALGGI